MNQSMSVTALNTYIKTLLDRDAVLQTVVVQGEISNYKVYPSGHVYFSLKDKDSSLRCVMFQRAAAKLRFEPTHGMSVIVYGSVSVFPRDGQYQLYATHMQPDGAGDLNVAFEQLKEKLDKEGLFDPAHKKPIPKYPRTVALITSGAGAAVRDMIRILGARYPYAEVKLLAVSVQGERAAAEIRGAILFANRWKVADVIITGRGGGSLEDLWAFNDEKLARAIYASEIPIISAVGHEPDITIADYVADLRASTPSNGAELAVPDRNELLAQLRMRNKQMQTLMRTRLKHEQERLLHLKENRHLKDPMNYIWDKAILLDRYSELMNKNMQLLLQQAGMRLSKAAAGLDGLSPLKVLSRGYTLVQDEERHTVSSVNALHEDDVIYLSLQDGTVKTVVKEVIPDGKPDGTESTEL